MVGSVARWIKRAERRGGALRRVCSCCWRLPTFLGLSLVDLATFMVDLVDLVALLALTCSLVTLRSSVFRVFFFLVSFLATGRLV